MMSIVRDEKNVLESRDDAPWYPRRSRRPASRAARPGLVGVPECRAVPVRLVRVPTRTGWMQYAVEGRLVGPWLGLPPMVQDSILASAWAPALDAAPDLPYAVLCRGTMTAAGTRARDVMEIMVREGQPWVRARLPATGAGDAAVRAGRDAGDGPLAHWCLAIGFVSRQDRLVAGHRTIESLSLRGVWLADHTLLAMPSPATSPPTSREQGRLPLGDLPRRRAWPI